MDAFEPIARLGGASAAPLRCIGVAVLLVLAAPRLASASEPLRLDATFRALASPVAAKPARLDGDTAAWGQRLALLGPPVRQPRRAPSDDDDATAPATDESAAPTPVPSAIPPVPSASPPVSSASPPSTSPPASAAPPVPSASPPVSLSPRIPPPRTIPEPAPDGDGDDEAAEPAEPDDASPGVASSADMARALSPESRPPPAPDEVVVDTGPSRLLRGKSVPPFWIDRQWTTHRTRALTFPPVFFHRAPTAGHPEKLAHFDLSLTTGWYSQRKAKRRYVSPLALFYGSFSERTSAWGAGALLMGYKRVGEQFNFGQFPLVWRWGNKQVKNLVVAPFHYHQKTPDGLRGFDVLLFWYGRKNLADADPLNDLRYFVGAPLFVQVSRGVKRTTVGVPFYLGGSDKLRGLTHRTVFPFAHWQSREFGNRHELWTLLYVQRSDTARKRRAWAVPPLLTFQQRSPEGSLTAVTPLVWRSENLDKGSVAWAVFPWVSYRDPEQRNRVLFPLYWQFDALKTGARSALLFPLGGATRRPGGGFGLVLPPLLTIARHDPKGRSFQVVTPLFWRFRDRKAFNGQGSQQIVVPPLFVYNQQGPRRDVAALPLLSFFGRDATRRYQVIAPLLFGHVRDRDPQRAHDTWVLGPLYVKRTEGATGKGWHAGLLPLVAAGSDDTLRYTVIPPLLFGDVTNVKEQRRLTLSPLFARSKGPDHRTLGVLNLFWDVKRAGDERHSVLFPLYYRRQKDGRALTMTPLGGGLRTKDRLTWMATPLLYGARDTSGPVAARRSSFGLVPLVFQDRRPVEGGVANNLVVVPLFARHRAPSEDLDMWSPLVWRTRTGGEKPRKNLAVFPFYFRQRQPGGVDLDAGMVPPFFYSRDPQRRTHTLIAGPFFHRLSRKQVNTGVVPLAWWMDSAESRRLVSLPLIVHMADKLKREHTTIAVPFWFDRRRGNGKRTWVALPFVIGTHGQFNFTRFSVAPPGYVDVFRLGKNYRFTGHAPLLFRYQKCGFREEDDDRCRYTLWGSFPLFLAGSDGLGRRTHGALGLYYFDRDKGGKRLYTLLGGANVRPGERLTWYALNTGRSVTRTHATTVVFPLLFRKAHRTEDRSTTVVLPPLFVARHQEDYRWFEAGLLLWHFRRPHKVATAIIPPIFYASHSFAERRLTWVAPLFLRDNNWAKDSSLTIVPPALVVQRRRGQDSDWVQFPLLWHIERGDNVGTVGLPVWWDITRKRARTQVVPALFARHTKKDRAVTVLGPGLGWWTRQTGKQKALHWRALFGIVGGGNEAGQRYFSLVGARIKLKPRPVWESRRMQRRLAAPKPTSTPTPTVKPAPGPTIVPATSGTPSTSATVTPGTAITPGTTATPPSGATPGTPPPSGAVTPGTAVTPPSGAIAPGTAPTPPSGAVSPGTAATPGTSGAVATPPARSPG